MTYFQDYLTACISIFTILNPLSAGAIMISLLDEGEHNKTNTKEIALKASKAVLIAIVVTVALGGGMISFFGINIFSIKVIGGAVLFLMAINMVHGNKLNHKHTKEDNAEALDKDDISIIPLAIPILFGPGMMAVLISEVAIMTTWTEYAIWIAAGLTITIVIYIILSNMVYVLNYLGILGVRIISRIMGLVVGALAVQLIVEGIKNLWSVS